MEQEKTFYIIGAMMENGHNINVVYENQHTAMFQFNEANLRLTKTYEAEGPPWEAFYQFNNAKGAFVTVNLNSVCALTLNEAQDILAKTDPFAYLKSALHS